MIHIMVTWNDDTVGHYAVGAYSYQPCGLLLSGARYVSQPECKPKEMFIPYTGFQLIIVEEV